jgi:hypothetical protein
LAYADLLPDIDSVLRLLAATLLAGAIGIGPELRDSLRDCGRIC